MNHLDLFSGIGGFALAARWSGFTTVQLCECNQWCIDLLSQNFPQTPIHNDIETLKYDAGAIDLITSGDPCQRDSRANSGRDGETMWPHTMQQIEAHRPAWVLRENVSGNIDTGTLERVEADLRAEGYECRSYHIPAICVGASHGRYRTWTVAHTDRARFKKCDNAAKPGKSQRRQHSLHVGTHGVYWVGAQSPVLRRVDDVPRRVDRIKGLGNAIVPELAYQLMKGMAV